MSTYMNIDWVCRFNASRIGEHVGRSRLGKGYSPGMGE